MMQRAKSPSRTTTTTTSTSAAAALTLTSRTMTFTSRTMTFTSTALTLTVTLAAALLTLPAVGAYSTGAPGKDCWTDRPLHGNNLPAHDLPPYRIELTKMDPKADPDTYSPGEMINVTIESRDDTPFRGYLMKVYSSNGVSRGVWGARRDAQHVLKRCGVTHSNNTLVTSTSIMWVAPKVPVMDNIQFKAIIVQNYTTFYNNILSRPLKPNYPTLSFDKIFERLVAFANMNFNVSLPTIPLPDPEITSLFDPSPSAAAPTAEDASQPANVTGSSGVEIPGVASGSGPLSTSGSDAPLPVASGSDVKVSQPAV